MLFEPATLRALPLSNRIVMSPMTRSRAVDNGLPNALMAEYYAQRATAGLIITEGVAPSPNGRGYARIPGIYNDAQTQAWRGVTDAVHARGGRIVVQLMHTGRVGHRANLPEGAEVLGPVDGACPGEIWTDAEGMQPHTAARAMTDDDIAQAVDAFVHAATLAMQAGFDGVELHGANGYLIEQFLNANVNTRTDAYGGDMHARNRFALDVVRATVAAIGADKVGIRLSPYSNALGTGSFPEVDAQYLALMAELSALGLLYVHVLDHSSLGTPPLPAGFLQTLRAAFDGPFILAGGHTLDTAQAAVDAGHADLVAFGRPFISNPDLVERFRTGAALNAPDFATFYTPGANGYTDYPTLTA